LERVRGKAVFDIVVDWYGGVVYAGR
jgi:hypothetical protein